MISTAGSLRSTQTTTTRPRAPSATARIRSLLGLLVSLVPAGRCTGGFPFLRMLGVVAVPSCLHGFAGGRGAFFGRRVASRSLPPFAPYLCRVDQSNLRSTRQR